MFYLSLVLGVLFFIISIFVPDEFRNLLQSFGLLFLLIHVIYLYRRETNKVKKRILLFTNIVLFITLILNLLVVSSLFL